MRKLDINLPVGADRAGHATEISPGPDAVLLGISLSPATLQGLRAALPAAELLLVQDVDAAARTVAERRVDLALCDAADPGAARRLEERCAGLAVLAIGPASDAIQLAKTRATLVLTERRAGALERTAAALEDLAVCGRLSAGVLHEANNILDAARRYAGLAAREDLDDGARRAHLADALRSLDRMAGLLRTTLELNREASLREPRRPLAEIIDEALRMTAADRGACRVQVSAGPGAPDAPGTLLQVLLNLLKNAFRACAGTGLVRIVAGCDRRSLRVVVEDDGCGFPPDAAERLFLPFHREDLRSPGTGLGLSVSRELCARAGGRLDGSSEGPGRGARFTVVLPLPEPVA